MGNWKLEVVKMTIYMAFPVGLFHYFNQPQYFEEWVINKRREMYPPDDRPELIEMKEAIRAFQKEQELKMLQAWEEKNK
ncbi:hypothetical protein RI129_001025 [Pyrocoelia pectoralis]|uniref:Protein PET100 homolog, mitochondrial n=1 Tax=Pyrocoelia pectoralis TaxID=417401 RepID=A0AAN7VTV5_9COLE